jgi:hypothetical protein
MQIENGTSEVSPRMSDGRSFTAYHTMQRVQRVAGVKVPRVLEQQRRYLTSSGAAWPES